MITGILTTLAFIYAGYFMYRITIGMPFYEHDPIVLPTEFHDFSVLVYSKTNGFNHKKAIRAAEELFQTVATDKGWTVVFTKSGGVFNKDQLDKFDAVVWNNVTGKTLLESQRRDFRDYIEKGGGFIGLHGSGDDSHHWPWYETELIGASFSHHSMNPQLQNGTLNRLCESSFFPCSNLQKQINLREEWYVFYDNPRDNGRNIIYSLDASAIDPNGNFLFLQRNKDWGMGEDHPIIWNSCVGKGRTFYSAIGHSKLTFDIPSYQQLLIDAIEWVGGLKGHCIQQEDYGL